MKVYVLLSANNVNMEIDVKPYPLLVNARNAMNEEWESVKKELGHVEESEIDTFSASLFTGNDDGDLYYWQIKEIEV